MVEQSHSGEAHCDSVFVAGFDYVFIANASAGFCYIGNTAAARSFNVVSEGEECVGRKSYAGDRVEICLLFFLCQLFRTGSEVVLPYVVAQHVLILFGDVNVDYVVSVGSAEGGKEGK